MIPLIDTSFGIPTRQPPRTGVSGLTITGCVVPEGHQLSETSDFFDQPHVDGKSRPGPFGSQAGSLWNPSTSLPNVRTGAGHRMSSMKPRARRVTIAAAVLARRPGPRP
jgi:hypothetical protein